MPRLNTDTNRELATLIEKHSLTRPRVAAVLEVNISTVDRWLVPATHGGDRNPTWRHMHPSHLKVLKAAIKAKKI